MEKKDKEGLKLLEERKEGSFSFSLSLSLPISLFTLSCFARSLCDCDCDCDWRIVYSILLWGTDWGWKHTRCWGDCPERYMTRLVNATSDRLSCFGLSQVNINMLMLMLMLYVYIRARAVTRYHRPLPLSFLSSFLFIFLIYKVNM